MSDVVYMIFEWSILSYHDDYMDQYFKPYNQINFIMINEVD